MDLQLKGKRALITGSSGGIGEGIAKILAKEDVTVVVHGRNEQSANRVAQEIEASGGKAFVALGDLSKDEDAQQVAEAALAAMGGIDILINNAGGYEQMDWMKSSPSKWADMYNHDVLSMVRLVQHLAPQMKELGWGRFIQISSSAGVQPYAFGPDYSAAKAAIINLSVSLAKDLAGTDITANTISPGPILTAGFEQLWRSYAKTKGWSDDWAEIERNVVKEVLPNPAGRVGRIEELASLVAFVSSPLAGYINGANLRVDGGYVVGVN
jgi:3-oxoacyl-[acyl-carrier protein] reductase